MNHTRTLHIDPLGDQDTEDGVEQRLTAAD